MHFISKALTFASILFIAASVEASVLAQRQSQCATLLESLCLSKKFGARNSNLGYLCLEARFGVHTFNVWYWRHLH
ncbi:hypothetical protein F5051DRAFT_447567 [Lentinula edodes]|nr:hypothetical protein F5051DRAFT_447567 [Lentinula edodes]